MTGEIELTSDPIYASLESNEGFTKEVVVKDKDGNVVLTYSQHVVFEDKATDDDLLNVFTSLDNAQKEFIKSVMNSS